MLAIVLLMPFVLEAPSIQGRLGGRLSSVLGELLGTRVEVGKVGFSLPARLTADDVTIYDLSQDTLLNVKRISAGVGLRDLADGKLTITSAQLFGADVRISQAEKGVPLNCQFIIDALSSDDSTSTGGIDLRVGSLIVRRSSVRFDRLYEPHCEAGFDANHMAVSDISGQVRLRALTTDSLNLVVKKLSLREQSGARIERLAANVVRGKESTRIKDFVLKMEESSISLDSLVYTHPADSVAAVPGAVANAGERLESSPIKGHLQTSDFAFLAPELNRTHYATNLSAKVEGEDGEYRLKMLTIDSDDGGLHVALNGSIDRTQSWVLNLTELTANSSAFAAAAHCLGDSATTAGRVVGTMNTMALSGEIQGDSTGSATFKAALRADSVNLGRMAEMAGLKSCNIEVEAIGELLKGKLSTTECKGLVSNLEYNNYKYSDINLSSIYNHDGVTLDLDLNDKNVDLALSAFYNPQEGSNSAKLNAHLTTLYLERLGLASETADYPIQDIFLTLGRDTQRRQFLDVKSPYGTARLVGTFDPLSLHHSVGNILCRHLSMIPSTTTPTKRVSNNYLLLVQLDNTEWLDRLLGVPLELHAFSEIYAKVDDTAESFIMSVNAPSFCYDGRHCDSLSLNIAQNTNRLNLDLHTGVFDDDGSYMSIRGAGTAVHDTIATNLSWTTANNPQAFSGSLNTHTIIKKDGHDNITTHLAILPSEIIIEGTTWEVEPSEIRYRPKNLSINHFAIGNEGQRLTVHGKASENINDSLVATLKDINVEYILDLVNFHSVDFGGRATGVARVKNLFDIPDAKARIEVNDFTFQHGDMGVLYADAKWNNEKKSIDIDAQAIDTLMDYQPFGRNERLTGTGRILIDGYISPANDDILLNMKAENGSIAFLQSFTKSFAKDVKGRVRGDLQLVGPLSKVNLVGNARVDGELFIKPLNCLYHLSDAPVSLVRDTIHLPGITIYDRYGNSGTVGGNIFHRNLGRISYDFGIDTKNMLCYDFKSFGEQTFYGTVFATGAVNIKGDSDEFKMTAELSPERGSSFTYNVSDQNSIANREFITWHDVTPRRNSSITLHPSSTTHHPSPTTHHPSSTTQKTENRKAKYLDDDMRLSFIINANPNVAIRLLMNSATDDYITLYGNGTLTAEYFNKGSFSMFGTYTVERGTYEMTIQDILKKNFSFQQGSTLVFGGDPFMADLDLQAVHTVNGVSISDLNIGNSYNSSTTRVNCLMNIGGKAMQPQVTFDIDLPTASNDERQMLRTILNSEDLMNQQVVYLLGIGRFYPQGTNNATAQTDKNQSETALAMQSLLSGTISGQLSTMLNSIINSNNWSFGANISTGNAGWDNAAYEGLLSGRLLDNRLIINGQFGYRDNASTDKSNFVGDFDVRYLLQPNGNLALKIYNQTNDKYFTKSSLNTQGVGLILKKDFTRLGDLFGKKEKGKKKNEKE